MNRYEIKILDDKNEGFNAFLFIEGYYIKMYENYYLSYVDRTYGKRNKEVIKQIQKDLEEYGTVIYSEAGYVIKYLESDMNLNDILINSNYNSPIAFSLREHHMLKMMYDHNKGNYNYLARDFNCMDQFFRFDVIPQLDTETFSHPMWIKPEPNRFKRVEEGRIFSNFNKDFKSLKNMKLYELDNLISCQVYVEKVNTDNEKDIDYIYNYLAEKTNCEVNDGYIDYIHYFFKDEKDDIYSLLSVDKCLISKWLDEYNYNLNVIKTLVDKEVTEEQVEQRLTTDFQDALYEHNQVFNIFESSFKEFVKMIPAEEFILYKLVYYVPYDCRKTLLKYK